MFTHYDALQIREDASAEVIRAAFKALAQKWHPDKNAEMKDRAEITFKAINTAYVILSNPNSRVEYDAALAFSRANDLEGEMLQSSLPMKESVTSRLWTGKVDLWRIVWIYLIGIPLSALLFEVTFARDNPGTYFFSGALLFCYLIFIHICMWRSAKRSTSNLSRISAKLYCLAVVSSPVWIGALVGASVAYDEWGVSQRHTSEQAAWMKAPIVEPSTSPTSAQPIIYTSKIKPVDEEDQASRQVAVFAADSARQTAANDPTEINIFASAVAQVYVQYPFLNSASPHRNQAAIDEVLKDTNSWVAKGYSRADSVKFAADQIAPKYQR